ncbi:MAG: alpha/beta fold hydrolase [Proteobacteria bacterium]|nr:alpha/beta fold hydrolase [Pseudomonadota bacterium]NIS67427.1 alpha/beta fold hydrolase [Pseudomonadota bacterium]
MDKTEITVSVRGMKVAGVLHLPDRRSPPCVIASHGLLSHKDSEKYVELGRRLCREGFAVIRFDFLGCGQSEGKPEDSTVTRRLEELGAVIDFVRSERYLGEAIGLMGSSLGGYLSLCKSAQEKDMKAVVTWATPYRLTGTIPEDEGVQPLGKRFSDDLKHHDLLTVLGRVHHSLVIHGDMDEAVPVTHATLIHENVGEPKRLEIIRGGDHRFTNPSHREAAYRLTVAWFRGHLGD